MTEFSFVHAADLHLDAPFRGLSDSLLADAGGQGRPSAERKTLARLLREASFLALERLTAFCILSGADFLLLAGDVYNAAESSLKARLALRDAFLRLKEHGIAVFLVHGNHDPLEQENGAISWPDNVTVFGRQAESTPAFARGADPSLAEPVALVHGVSHAGPREGKNLARKLKRRSPSLLEPQLFQIGLLHCALSGLSGGHDQYAPCSLDDLQQSELDYWALGHVHACRLLDRQGKLLPTVVSPQAPAFQVLAAYSGSLQGLHVNESGPHGCLWVKAGASGRVEARPVPLAPVQWEQLAVECGQPISDISALETHILAVLEQLAPEPPSLEARKPAEEPGPDAAPEKPGFPPEAVLARLTLRGRTGLDHELRRPGALEALQDHMATELAGSGVFIRDIILDTRPLLDMAAALARQDLSGEILRQANALRGEPQELQELAAQALEPLFRRPKIRKTVTDPDEEELQSLVDEAVFLCLDLLGTEQAALLTDDNGES